MAAGWHPDEDITPTPNEVEMMASVLEGKHGIWAEQVAAFFTEFNAKHGDAPRSWAWAAVGERVRQRECERLSAR